VILWSRNFMQSRPLRARRDASIASTAPTRPCRLPRVAAQLKPEPERPRSSSMTVTSVQPIARARSARPYCRRALMIIGKLVGSGLPDVDEGAAR